MSLQEHNRLFMQQALQLAEQRRGFCAPNPAVGAVVVKAGKIIGQGLHWGCGHPHAEVRALHSLGKEAKGATLYVTLEPCSHQGRTPPCTDLVIRSGIAAVFYGTHDPNPMVRGGGKDLLLEAGIDCHLLAEPEIDHFYQSYFYWLRTGMPWVTIKLAISFDGKIAGAQGKPIPITGNECRNYTHQQRLRSDSILTSAATILTDNPQLNVRLTDQIIAKPLYILDSHLRIPLTAQVFRTAHSLTIFHASTFDAKKRAQLEDAGVRCKEVRSDENGLDLKEVLTRIGRDGCHDLWVEAGSRCFQSFLSAHLAQTALFYVAPKILGEDATPAFNQPAKVSVAPEQIIWTVCGRDMIAQINFGVDVQGLNRTAL